MRDSCGFNSSIVNRIKLPPFNFLKIGSFVPIISADTRTSPTFSDRSASTSIFSDVRSPELETVNLTLRLPIFITLTSI